MATLLSVVLLQHRLSAMTKVALQSILESDLPPDDIILVDNGSPEEDVAWVEGQPVRLIRLPDNVGYLKGTNVGWREAQGDLILLCNNDIALSKQCIRRMVLAMQKDDTIGWLTACYQSGPWQNSRVFMPDGVVAELDASRGSSRDNMNVWSESLGDDPVIEYPPVTEGTVIMVRKALSDKIGHYWEELWSCHTHDYAIRIRGAGYKTASCKNAVFWHSEKHPTLVLVTGETHINANTASSYRAMNSRYGEGKWQDG